MFFDQQTKENQQYYKEMLQTLGALSRLFSDSNKPSLYYRATENLFCKAFEAKNLSRGDISIDASKDNIGIGIKTYVENSEKSLQKIAEFNKDHGSFKNLNPKELIIKICALRNARIQNTKDITGVNSLYYHCVVRKPGKIYAFEEPMCEIDIENIKDVKEKKNGSITFTDGKHNYSFYKSKSTLLKYFEPKKILFEIPVKIIEDPFASVRKIKYDNISFTPTQKGEHVYLPLYSTRDGKVPERSGLNQWNARGRKRNPSEVYIPIPSFVRKKYPEFFPPRGEYFNLELPNDKVLSASICQDGDKAIMSNPNSALGEWVLRDIMKVEEGHLVTYEDLKNIDLDSVVVYKLNDHRYTMDFTNLGSYEKFESNPTFDEMSDDEKNN